MTERACTVKELDALRRVVEWHWLFGSYVPGCSRFNGRSYKNEEKTKCVEELVRTHMLAGHTAEDLIVSENENP